MAQRLAVCMVSTGIAVAASASACAAEDFYKGKSLTILAGFQAGSGYDT
jgi:hypothetical protein